MKDKFITVYALNRPQATLTVDGGVPAQIQEALNMLDSSCVLIMREMVEMIKPSTNVGMLKELREIEAALLAYHSKLERVYHDTFN